MLNQRWATVYDVGSTLVQHWVDVSCLLGDLYVGSVHGIPLLALIRPIGSHVGLLMSHGLYSPWA